MESLFKEKGEDVCVLQIGAMDGITFDPVHEYITRYNWSSLLIEPMPEQFKKLQENYAPYPKVSLENIAIAEHIGEVTLHTIPTVHVEQGTVPKWGVGATSLYKDRNALAFEKVAPLIVEQTVSCTTLEVLLEKHTIESIDVLQIDTEGYDYHVLKQLDLNKYTPKVINMEIVNLPKDEQNKCKQLLDQFGYLHTKAGYDLLAIRDLI